MLDAARQLAERVDQRRDLVPRQVQVVDVLGDQDLERRAQPVDLHLAPQLALITGDAVHDVRGDVAKVFGELVRNFRLLLEQVRLVEVPLERSERVATRVVGKSERRESERRENERRENEEKAAKRLDERV